MADRLIPQVIENKKRYSWELVRKFVNFGNTYLLKRYNTPKKAKAFIKRRTAKKKVPVSISCVEPQTEIKRSIIVATTSCTNRKPIEIFPYSLVKSPLSEMSLNIIIVLEKVKAIAPYKEAIRSKPRKIIIKNPIIEVTKI